MYEIELINEYCKEKGYSMSLRNFIIELFLDFSSKASKEEISAFLNSLLSCTIILTHDMNEFVNVIANYTMDKIGYEMSYGEKLMMSFGFKQKGIYLPLPDIKTKDISRIVVARVNKKDEITSDEDKVTLSHELFHLFRSCSDDEFEYINGSLCSKSGVISTIMPITNGQIDYVNSTKENEQCEENFVNFLGEKQKVLFHLDSIENVFQALENKVNDDNLLSRLSSNEINEIITLYINLLLVVKIYDGKISSCLVPKNANFLETIELLYGRENTSLFSEIYSRKYHSDLNTISQLDKIFSSKKLT